MFGLFGKKKPNVKALEEALEYLQLNLENNYKDEARKALNESIRLIQVIEQNGELEGKKLAQKKSIVANYTRRMEGYGHNEPTIRW